MHSFSRLSTIFIFVAIVIMARVSIVHAASLQLSPASGSYAVDQTFAVTVSVSSADRAMNSVSGVVTFPTDSLEVSSISKTGSILNLWVQEPSFSNAGGTVNFEGIVLNPGFTGSNGKIITITFKVKARAAASLALTSATVLANDGKGTNILAGVSGSKLTLTDPAAPPPPVGEKKTIEPTTPVITSSTHLNQSSWYNLSTVKFAWTVPSTIDAMSLVVDDKADTVPPSKAQTIKTEWQLDKYADGAHYLHLKFRTKQGTWGATSHYRFLIDTKNPTPVTIQFPRGKESEDNRPSVIIASTDDLSGIAYYEVTVDGVSQRVTVDEVKQGPYILVQQEPGTHTITVRAYDLAGNFSEAQDSFIVKGLEAPSISKYPSEIVANVDRFTIEGYTYPETQVTVSLTNPSGQTTSETTQSVKFGYFSLQWPSTLTPGTYTVKVTAQYSDGRQTAASQSLTIISKERTLLPVGSTVVNYYATNILAIIGLLTIIFGIIWGLWYRLVRYRRRVHKNVRATENYLHSVFDGLHGHLRDNIELLERTQSQRPLTPEEVRILLQLKDDLVAAERMVETKIEEIE